MKKNKKLIICAAIAVLPIILVVAFVFRGMHDRKEYKQFLLDFDRSITFALKRDMIKAELYGDLTRLNEKNANSIYKIILDGGYHYYDGELPETDKVLLIDFGTGEKMRICPECPENGLSSFIVRYISLEGEEYTYLTAIKYRFANLEKMVSIEFGNKLWEE